MDDQEAQEELARLKAEMDQGIAGMGELARALWALFTELREQGFDDVQAMRLTARWMSATIQGLEPEE